MNSWIKNHFLPLIDQNAKTVVVIRHGHREKNTTGSFGNDLPLTKEGRQASSAFGSLMRGVSIGEVHTSPVLRCIQTTEELLKGACQPTDVRISHVLGNPGPFIFDTVKAGPLFLQRSIQEIAQTIVDKKELPGMRSLVEGGIIFLNHVARVKKFPCLMVSHDIVICLLCCFLFESKNVEKYMPDFLDGFGVIIHSGHLSIYHHHQLCRLRMCW